MCLKDILQQDREEINTDEARRHFCQRLWDMCRNGDDAAYTDATRLSVARALYSARQEMVATSANQEDMRVALWSSLLWLCDDSSTEVKRVLDQTHRSLCPQAPSMAPILLKEALVKLFFDSNVSKDHETVVKRVVDNLDPAGFCHDIDDEVRMCFNT